MSIIGIEMKEIRFHGRGGQGVVTSAEILGAAAFHDGKYSQAFPAFGAERRGAPVTAFTRIDEKFIRIRSQIYQPDYVIVQDASLLGVLNVADGLKSGGKIIVNTEKKQLKLKTDAKVIRVDATKIALDNLGVPIVNTTMLGTFVGITKEVSLDSLKKAVSERFPERIAAKNLKAIDAAYSSVGGGE